MGIFDFLKKKKDQAEPDVNKGTVDNEASQNNTNDDESKPDIFDNMSGQ